MVKAQLPSPYQRTTPTITGRPADDKQKYPMLKQILRGQIFTIPFRFPPTNIQYDNLAPEWVEVERPGLVPLVGLRQYRLMRIQFEFLLSHPFDGILLPVDNELIALREMANNPEPVYLMNMDELISTAFILPGGNKENADGNFYRIVDLNINSLRRNTENAVTAAQCSITLQEDFRLSIKAVSMPEINYPPILKPRVSKPKGNDLCKGKSPQECQRAVTSSILQNAGNLNIGFLGVPPKTTVTINPNKPE